MTGCGGMPGQEWEAQQPDPDPDDEGAAPAAQSIGHGSRNAKAAARFAPFTRSSPAGDPTGLRAPIYRFLTGSDSVVSLFAGSGISSFQESAVKDQRVEGASGTAAFATQLNNGQAGTNDASGPPPGDLPNAPASDTDSLSPLQWDMRQVHTPEAHAITGGSPSVLVGDIDTGIDAHHPDFRQNLDAPNSVSCICGVPDQNPAAWNDGNVHGTHTA